MSDGLKGTWIEARTTAGSESAAGISAGVFKRTRSRVLRVALLTFFAASQKANLINHTARWVASNGSDFAATLLQSDGRKFGFLAKGENTLPAAYYRNRKCKRLCLCVTRCMIRC